MRALRLTQIIERENHHTTRFLVTHVYAFDRVFVRVFCGDAFYICIDRERSRESREKSVFERGSWDARRDVSDLCFTFKREHGMRKEKESRVENGLVCQFPDRGRVRRCFSVFQLLGRCLKPRGVRGDARHVGSPLSNRAYGRQLRRGGLEARNMRRSDRPLEEGLRTKHRASVVSTGVVHALSVRACIAEPFDAHL